MSFSSDIKSKLCNIPCHGLHEMQGEVAGMLRLAGRINGNTIRFATENELVAKRLSHHFQESFGFSIRPEVNAKVYQFVITDRNIAENIKAIIEDNGYLELSDAENGFLRGAFLGCGSVSNPKKNYHLEFVSKQRQEAMQLKQMLEKKKISSKITERKGYQVIYIKEGDAIAAALSVIGADQGALELFNVQVEKDMRNLINRRVNCENANADKAAKASSRHLYAIRKLKKTKEWDELPDVLKEIAVLREEYPEDSLKELGEKTNPPIGKSGVNHRLNRILERAEVK